MKTEKEKNDSYTFKAKGVSVNVKIKTDELLISHYLLSVPKSKKKVSDKIEILLSDPNVEEICINSAKEPVWLYHKKYKWMITDIKTGSDKELLGYISEVGKKVGKTISTQHPLLDAYLSSGDRINATLYPVSIDGTTMTIRKGSNKSWTIVDAIANKTISPEVAAFIWQSLQYEMNMIVAGGTGSGKTTALTAFSAFLNPNNRVISIEQTHELKLPKTFQWVPLVVRDPDLKGEGGISMNDLLVNSLRMRPDRLIVGEVRTANEAEVLFGAMHTGHPVMATFHAETSEQAFRRITNPPLNIPPVLFESLHLICIMYRDRRTGVRRLYELCEVVPASGQEGTAQHPNLNVLYKWDSVTDKIKKVNDSYRIIDDIQTFTRMSDTEIKEDFDLKVELLKTLAEKNIREETRLSHIFAEFNINPKETIKKVISGKA